MNYSYWANAPDLMKWDILSYLAKEDERSILYIPMLTLPRNKEFDFKYLTYEMGTKNIALTNFIKPLFSDNSSHPLDIQTYFSKQKIKFNAFDYTAWFTDDSRADYFHRATALVKSVEARKLVFVDPDVGGDIGIKRRFRSKKEMYLKSSELLSLRSSCNENDSIIYFQHTGNTSYSIEARLKDLKAVLGDWVFIAGYHRIQSSLVFVFNNELEFSDKREKIKLYFKQYEDIGKKDKFILT